MLVFGCFDYIKKGNSSIVPNYELDCLLEQALIILTLLLLRYI